MGHAHLARDSRAGRPCRSIKLHHYQRHLYNEQRAALFGILSVCASTNYSDDDDKDLIIRCTSSQSRRQLRRFAAEVLKFPKLPWEVWAPRWNSSRAIASCASTAAWCVIISIFDFRLAAKPSL